MDVYYENEEFLIGNNKSKFILKNVDVVEFEKEANETFKYIDNILCNLYTYNGIDMYSFARGSVVEEFRKVLTKFFIIKSIRKNISNSIIIHTDDDVIYEICKILNLKVKYNKSICGSNRALKVNSLLRKTLSGFFKVFLYKINRGIPKEKILIVTNSVGDNSIVIAGKIVNYDSYYGKVYDDLINEYNVMEVNYDRNKKKKRNQCCSTCISYDYLAIVKKIKKHFIKINKNEIKNDLNMLIKNEFYFMGINITELFTKYIVSSLEDRYISYIYEILTLDSLMKKNKFKKVITIDEADRFRCFIVAANMNGIDSYAIQHGIIKNASYSYIIPGCNKELVPKKTFVWGQGFKDQLINNTKVYNDENLIVVGQPRTDILFDLVKEKSSSKEEKIKILYATQNDLKLTSQATEILCEALSKISNYEMIIKIHPLEDSEDYYKDFVKKYNLKNVIITRDKDIYECINWSNVIVSVHSTVILEGAIMNKPSICILLPDFYDLGDFVKEGLSFGVENSSQLAELLEGDIINSNFSSKYINKYLYKIDGLVHKRIRDEILEDII